MRRRGVIIATTRQYASCCNHRWPFWNRLLAVLCLSALAISVTVSGSRANETVPQAKPSTSIQGVVKPGQSVFVLLRQAGVEAAEALQLQRAIRSVYDIRHVRVGHAYSVDVTADGLLQRFMYEIDDQKRLEAERQNETFTGRLLPIAYAYKQRVIQGVIQGSLYEALAGRQESLKIAADLVDIFAWEIDFHTDLRDGDAYRLLIEERFRDDAAASYYRILAAELVCQRRVVQAILYPLQGDDGAYYHPDGRSLRRMFLRSPLRYTRISSRFSHRRFHPVLKRYRPHLGIDYAAPIGTPVRSVADGVVVQAGRRGANGKMIKIRHNRVYSTYYLHLSRFARGIRPGGRVGQGQVIGYVGSTGLSTGPHLDFRLTKNGTYLNPLVHQSLEAPPLARRTLPVFHDHAERLLAKLKHPETTSRQMAAHASSAGQDSK